MATNQGPVNAGHIKIDASKIDNMKCWCGSQVFIQVHNLKFISPIMIGDPKGGTINVMQWACLKCMTYYPGAVPQEQVRKFRPKKQPGQDQQPGQGQQPEEVKKEQPENRGTFRTDEKGKIIKGG